VHYGCSACLKARLKAIVLLSPGFCFSVFTSGTGLSLSVMSVLAGVPLHPVSA
jgi:hypothetical protein